MKVIIDNKEYIAKDEQNSKQNSGDRNSGYWNSGDWNSGNRNSGDRNSGNWNSGDWNSGDWNSGYWNSGNWNSGDWNSGDWNSGYWNSGDWNSGYCNVGEPFIMMFGKLTKFKSKDVGTKILFPNYFYFELTKWIAVSEMNEADKEKYPKYAITEGFLRVFEYKEAWKNSFMKATKEDVALTLKLPNFNYTIFEEISGISKEMLQERIKNGKMESN